MHLRSAITRTSRVNRYSFSCAIVALIGAFSSAALAAEDDKLVEDGEQVYGNYCETCHGTKLRNTGQVAFDLRKLRPDERERFQHSVTNGKNQMPPWKGVLSEADMNALWAFIMANRGNALR